MALKDAMLSLYWTELQPAWNETCDKRYEEALRLVEAPAIMHDDIHPLTRFKYFEKEHNLKIIKTPEDVGSKYDLLFDTEQDLTFFMLKWM